MSRPPRSSTTEVIGAGAEPPQRSGTVAWLTVRITGVVLAVLVVGHFALTHIITDVAETDSSFVAARWGSALFVAWDGVMLVAAVVHGGIGVWIALREYAHTDRWRRRFGAMTASISALMLVGGLLTLVIAVF